MAKNSSSKERALERARAREKARMENGQKHKQRRGGSKKGILFMLGVLLVGTLITLCFTVFFQIESIQVTGESIYDAQLILQAAGIEEGQNLLSLNSAKISAKVSTALPYISQVKLHKNLPAQLVIEVVPAQVTRVYLCENTYAWCDSEDKIIELSGQPAPDSMVIRATGISAGQPGEHIAFTDESQLALLGVLQTACDQYGLSEGMTYCDISDPLNIKLIWKNMILVDVGMQNNLDYKMRAVAKALIDSNETRSGVLNVSSLSEDANTYTFRPQAIENPLPTFTQEGTSQPSSSQPVEDDPSSLGQSSEG